MYSSFEDYIIKLFNKNDFKSKEFQTAISLWGRPKIVEIWNKYKQSKQELTIENYKKDSSIQDHIDELFKG